MTIGIHQEWLNAFEAQCLESHRHAWGRPAGERMRRDYDANLAADRAIEAEWERIHHITYGPLGEEWAP